MRGRCLPTTACRKKPDPAWIFPFLALLSLLLLSLLLLLLLLPLLLLTMVLVLLLLLPMFELPLLLLVLLRCTLHPYACTAALTTALPPAAPPSLARPANPSSCPSLRCGRRHTPVEPAQGRSQGIPSFDETHQYWGTASGLAAIPTGGTVSVTRSTKGALGGGRA